MKDEYVMETGLASDSNPVIKCSPGMYNMLIKEARAIFEEELKVHNKIHHRKVAKKLAKKSPALAVLSAMPLLDLKGHYDD